MRVPAIASLVALAVACGGPRDDKRPEPSVSPSAPAEHTDAKTETTREPEPAAEPEADEPEVDEPEAAGPAGAAPAESAIVASDAGLVLVDVATGEASTVWNGEVEVCLSDPAASAIWFLGRSEGTTSLYAHDLKTGGQPAVIATGIPAEAAAISVTSWQGGKIESAPITAFRIGVLLDVRSTPRIQRFVGCMADGLDCFSDIDTETLRPELEAIAARIDGLSVADPGTAKRLGDRSAGALAATPPEIAPRVTVPTAPCEVDREACGSARVLPGTSLQLVVVATSQGDFYHESVLLHDPKTGDFMPLADPRTRSRAADGPGMQAVEPSQLWVAPSGLAYSYDERVVHLKNGPIFVAESGAARACGFKGGGERITAVAG